MTLRSHLTRLTAELSSHQTLLAELRVLRDKDQKILQEKMSEVDKSFLETNVCLSKSGRSGHKICSIRTRRYLHRNDRAFVS